VKTLGRKKAAFKNFFAAVRADYASVQENRSKYHQETISLKRMPVDLVRKIGFQTLTVVRLMQLCRDLRLPVAPMVLSRALRHVYGTEIHWDADIAPGVSIVHGVGLVISHAATVGEKCILFHNVTLGEGLDKETKKRGAPTLEERVHVGPGATLLGPIVVGMGTKIGAGAVLDHSVPPNSLVMPQGPKVVARSIRREDA
jgi:serine O-acetyltransferase